MLVHLIIGTRPNIIKAAPVYKELSKLDGIDLELIHTGQHYDSKMKDIFFDDLKLPNPSCFLDGKGSTHSEQTGKIMMKYEQYCFHHRPDLIVVFGDVDSTLACSLVGSKMNIPIAHVESGLRSFDRMMPEEINRVLTDQLSKFLFTTSPEAEENLLKEGRSKKQIYYVGNTMIDSLIDLNHHFDTSNVRNDLGIKESYSLMTFHRPSNVDSPQNLNSIINSIIDLSKIITCVFPIHPRTKIMLDKLSLTEKMGNEVNIIITGPLRYIDFMSLEKKASLVITDSGGIQEETTFLGVPCLTVRDTTERPITITKGSNKLIGNSYSNIVNEAKIAMKLDRNKVVIPPLWDGKASNRISEIIKNCYNIN